MSFAFPNGVFFPFVHRLLEFSTLRSVKRLGIIVELDMHVYCRIYLRYSFCAIKGTVCMYN